MSNCANNSIFWGYFSSLARVTSPSPSPVSWVKASYWPVWPLISPDLADHWPPLWPTNKHCIPNILEKQYRHCRPQTERSQDSLHVGRELIRNSEHFYLWHHHSIILHIRNNNSQLHSVLCKIKFNTPQTSKIFSPFCHHIHSVRPFMILVSCL